MCMNRKEKTKELRMFTSRARCWPPSFPILLYRILDVPSGGDKVKSGAQGQEPRAALLLPPLVLQPPLAIIRRHCLRQERGQCDRPS